MGEGESEQPVGKGCFHDAEAATRAEVLEAWQTVSSLLPAEGEKGGCGCKHASNPYHACTVRRPRIERATFCIALPITTCQFD